MIVNSYTKYERAKTLVRLKKACNSKLYRNPYTCSRDYISDNAPCIMDVLNCITSDKGSKYYYDTYNRIGRKVNDNFDQFVPTESEPCSLSDLVTNNSRLNISIRFRRNGVVRLNPVQAKKVGLPSEVNSYIFRTHNIIKDGNLNTSDIVVELSVEALQTLRDLLGESYTNIEEILKVSDPKSPQTKKVRIQLEKLPVINRSYEVLFNEPTKLHELVHRKLSLECKLKAYKYVLSEKESSNYDCQEKYSQSQIELLKEYGINDKGCYCGIDNKVDYSSDDYYIARSMKLFIKGSASVPSVNKVLKDIESNKKLNYASNLISDALQEARSMNLSDLSNKINSFTEERKVIDYNLCSSKIAMVMTGKQLDSSKYTEDKDDQYSYSNLIIKFGEDKISL